MANKTSAKTQGHPDAQEKIECIATLAQRQDLNLKVHSVGAEIEGLRGPVDEVRWTDITMMRDMIQSAIIRAGVMTEMDLVASTEMSRSDKGWNPVVSLWTINPDLSGDQIALARQIAATTLTRLNTRPLDQHASNDDCVQDDDVEPTVLKVVEEVLDKVGGRIIHHPVVANCGPEIRKEVTGRLAKKRNRADFNPVPVEISGTIEGFRNCHGKRNLFVNTDSSPMLIGFAEEMVGQEVDLAVITQLHLSQTSCRFHVNRTQDARGAFAYSFVSIKADASSQ